MRIYDNGGKSWDRYTVIPDNVPYLVHMGYKMYECLGLSDNCNMPNGYSMWGTCNLGRHLGKIVKLEDLPENVQKHIKERLSL